MSLVSVDHPCRGPLCAVSKVLQGEERCNTASCTAARKGFTAERFLISKQRIVGEHRNHLGISSLHWHTQMLLIDVPAGSKLHSPLLDLIFIGSPGVLHPDVGTFQLNGKGVHTGRMANNACLF